MCQAAFDLGPAKNPAEIFALAEEHFTQAITAAQAAGATDILDLARVGRARVRLNLGKAALAAEDARLVPASFVKNATFSNSTLRRYNFVFYENRSDVVVVEGPFRNKTYLGVKDPRVKVTDTGRLFIRNIAMCFDNTLTSSGERKHSRTI